MCNVGLPFCGALAGGDSIAAAANARRVAHSSSVPLLFPHTELTRFTVQLTRSLLHSLPLSPAFVLCRLTYEQSVSLQFVFSPFPNPYPLLILSGTYHLLLVIADYIIN